MIAIRFALEVPQELFGDDFVETKLELRHACALAQLRLKMNKMLVLLHGVVILSAPVLKGLARISHVSSAASGAFVSNIPCISTAGNLSLCLNLSKHGATVPQTKHPVSITFLMKHSALICPGGGMPSFTFLTCQKSLLHPIRVEARNCCSVAYTY